MHVHSDQHVYLDDPQPVVPPRRSPRGRTPSRLQAQCEPVRVDALVKELAPADWERVVVRETTVGPLVVDIHRRQVWVWNGDEEQARLWQLVIRRDCTSAGDIKYCLTNAQAATSTVTLARMEAQRFWIERAFEDAKSEVSMADYQVRNWLAWHHHMALVFIPTTTFNFKLVGRHKYIVYYMRSHKINLKEDPHVTRVPSTRLSIFSS